MVSRKHTRQVIIKDNLFIPADEIMADILSVSV